MTTDLSKLKVLCVDQGLFVELAVRLARDFGKVYYFCPWQNAFPKMNNAKIGRGLDGIEVVSSMFGPFLDDVDLVVFPDVNFAEEQLRMEKEFGKKVWGARRGERMELDRVWAKEQLKKHGLPVQHYEVVTGMDALREYLKSHRNVYVKVSTYRGTFETFNAQDYKSVEPKLDEVEYKLGGFKHDIEFLVEDAIDDAVELGLDAYCIDGKFPSKLMGGIEIKDMGYVGIFKEYKDFPEPLLRFNTTFESYFRAVRYRGFFSADTRITTKGLKPFMTDACMRAASPPNELYQEVYTNLAEIVLKGAEGIVVDPVPVAKYGAELLIHSSWADANWQPVDFPEELRRFVKLRNATRIKNRYYVIPQTVGLPEIGSVIGYGASLQAAIEMCLAVAKEVKGYYLHIPDETFEKAQEEIAKTEKAGLKMF